MKRAIVIVAVWTTIGTSEAAGQIGDRMRLPPPKILVPLEIHPELAIINVRRVDGSVERVRLGDVFSVMVFVRNTGGSPATVQAGTHGDPGRGEDVLRYGAARTIPPGETVPLPLELHATGGRFRGNLFVPDIFLFEARGGAWGLRPLFRDGNNRDNQFEARFGFRPPDERAVRLLAYNVQFLPPIADDSRCIELRARLIAEQIERHGSTPDILAFSEVFDDEARAILINELADQYPHRTRILGRDSGIEQDGGVIILSRWPIATEDQRAYGSVCAGMDCRADKGVLYARVRTRDLTVHVFATHLEAQTRDIKRRQVDIVREFINSKSIPADQPVLIAGDFNIDAYSSDGNYPYMLDRLNADALGLEGYLRHSVDYTANDMARGHGSGTKLIDHVLISMAHLAPSRSRARIQTYRSPWWEEEDDWSANECGTGSRRGSDVTNYQDLSDHYAIQGYVQY